MRYALLLISVILLFACDDVAYAAATDDRFIETRYCGPPERYENGKIKRSLAVRLAFESLYPLPADEDRAKWQVDHILPLVEGGCDAVRNMQWLPIVIKTCSDKSCKDRWEQEIYKDRNERVIRIFEELYPLPPGEKRIDWDVLPVIPFSSGGYYSISNMQWVPKNPTTNWWQDATYGHQIR